MKKPINLIERFTKIAPDHYEQYHNDCHIKVIATKGKINLSVRNIVTGRELCNKDYTVKQQDEIKKHLDVLSEIL